MADIHHADVLRINEGSRPAVAALDHAELERLIACGGLHLVAEADDRAIVGYALTFTDGDRYDGEEFRYFTAHLHRPFVYIDQVAADRSRKREGIGRKLYEALVAHARARAVATLCCEVNTSPPNPASLEFHRQLGFTPIGEHTVLDGRRVTFLVSDL
jgi:uncharacterized protein